MITQDNVVIRGGAYPVATRFLLKILHRFLEGFKARSSNGVDDPVYIKEKGKVHRCGLLSPAHEYIIWWDHD